MLMLMLISRAFHPIELRPPPRSPAWGSLLLAPCSLTVKKEAYLTRTWRQPLAQRAFSLRQPPEKPLGKDSKEKKKK